VNPIDLDEGAKGHDLGHATVEDATATVPGQKALPGSQLNTLVSAGCRHMITSFPHVRRRAKRTLKRIAKRSEKSERRTRRAGHGPAR
jgi:hypothetical protein